jgi:aerobic-type carbon monoxide dehydrogenase small subunit (CoxS/CutS family)
MRLLPTGPDHASSSHAQDQQTPTDTDIDAIMNVCRCGTYSRIRAAIKRAARLI